MQRLAVQSSDIVSIGYDPADKLLEVEFHGGRVYQYRNVEPEIYGQFMRADSYGTFFFAHINGQYRYDKIEPAGTSNDASLLVFVNSKPTDLYELEMACEQYDIDIETLEMPLDEIQSESAEELITKKSKQAHDLLRRPIVVEAVLWNILALRGFPGAYMTAVARWLTPEDFLHLMHDKTDRAICLTKTIAYSDGKRTKTFSHNYWGTVIDAPRGEGSSIERLIVLSGQDKTLAELRQIGLKTWTVPKNNVWQDFAKWLHMYQRTHQR
jgi:inosine/xanthosine triphosphate pyrophosphatase family protein